MLSAAPGRLRRPILAFLVFCCAFLSATAQTATPSVVQAMKLVSGQSGWVLAQNRLFWTNSLGAQWAEVTPPAAGAIIHGVSFNAAGHGWVAETQADGTFALASTADRGEHWSTNSVPSPFTDGIEFGGSASPSFTDDAHGWLMLSVQSSSNFSRGILLQTTDGGAHWSQLPAPPVGGDIQFTDASHGFAGPGSKGDDLYATADGGQSWLPVALAGPSSLVNTPSKVSLPSFTDAAHGSLLRSYNQDSIISYVQYTTADGGKTWQSRSAVQGASQSLIAMSAAGVATRSIPSVSAQGIVSSASTGPSKLAPVQATFSTSTQGWVVLSGGSCAGTSCTQTATLQGTLDGGKTFFALGKLPGISIETTRTSARTVGGQSAVHAPQIFTPNVNFTGVGATPFVGQMGFDKCEILTTSQMQDWYTNSPYRVVGAYIGGISRACTNVGFTQSWAASTLAQGWGIIAIWVGPQAPNSTLAHKLSGVPATDQATGVTEADSAVTAAAALGFGPGSNIYYDMEAYTRTAASEASTQAFLEGWTTELHAKGYTSAVYSSHPELQDWEAGKIADPPDSIWYAYFFSTGVACGTRCQTTTDSTDIPNTFWGNNQRVRQTSSSFTSTYGTTAASIDEDWSNGPVIAISSPQRLTVSLIGSGGGTVASADGFINCGTVCAATYAPSTSVTLTATPAALSSFAKFTGCASVSGNTCTVTPGAASSVVVDFEITPPVFTVTSSTNALVWYFGQSAAATLTLSSKAPYKGVYTFACSGLPSYMSCAFSPSTLVADGTGTALTTKLSLSANSVTSQNRNIHSRSVLQFALLVGLFAPFTMASRRRQILRSKLLLAVIALAGFIGTQALMGCSDNGPTTKTLYTGNFTVTATSDGVSQQIPMSVTLYE